MGCFINLIVNFNALLAVFSTTCLCLCSSLRCIISSAIARNHLHNCMLNFKQIMKYLTFPSAITGMSAWHICLLTNPFHLTAFSISFSSFFLFFCTSNDAIKTLTFSEESVSGVCKTHSQDATVRCCCFFSSHIYLYGALYILSK